MPSLRQDGASERTVELDVEEGDLKITTLADLHGELPLTVPECDLLLIAGDITGGNPAGPRAGDDDLWHAWCMDAFNDCA